MASSTKHFVWALILAIAAASGALHAKEVSLSHKGLALNADLSIANGKKLADGVIIITHGTLAHRGMELIAELQKLLNERGYNTLAINLSLGIDNRRGMYDCKLTHRHRNADTSDEIRAWIDWLKQQGVQRVTLLGHSRGGLQTALYAAERDNPLVQAVVLLAPATRENNDATAYQQRYGKALAPLLSRAEVLVKAGRDDAIIRNVDFLTCRNTSVTAASFVSYYSDSPSLDTPSLLPKIRKPTLVIVAGDDEIVVALDKRVMPLVDGRRLQMKIVSNADHFFRDLHADEAVDAVSAFLKTL